MQTSTDNQTCSRCGSTGWALNDGLCTPCVVTDVNAPKPFIRENAGSFRLNGWRGLNADLVLHAFFLASDGTVRPDVRMAEDVAGWFFADATGWPWFAPTVDPDLPPGAIRYFLRGRLVAEVRGFTE